MTKEQLKQINDAELQEIEDVKFECKLDGLTEEETQHQIDLCKQSWEDYKQKFNK